MAKDEPQYTPPERDPSDRLLHIEVIAKNIYVSHLNVSPEGAFEAAEIFSDFAWKKYCEGHKKIWEEENSSDDE